VIETLNAMGVDVKDVGAFSEDSVDYPDFAETVASDVGSGHRDRGILVCGTGIGMSIAANKIEGVRAALVRNAADARMSRLHNDANVLVLSGDDSDESSVREIVRVWWNTEFEGGRHARRVAKIAELERRRRAGESR
jgi:RpiB/LacA/LacB family sugar-phosphate isomerase